MTYIDDLTICNPTSRPLYIFTKEKKKSRFLIVPPFESKHRYYLGNSLNINLNRYQFYFKTKEGNFETVPLEKKIELVYGRVLT